MSAAALEDMAKALRHVSDALRTALADRARAEAAAAEARRETDAMRARFDALEASEHAKTERIAELTAYLGGSVVVGSGTFDPLASTDYDVASGGGVFGQEDRH